MDIIKEFLNFAQMSRQLTIAMTAIALMLSIHSHAQPASFGAYNSLKGIGVALELPRDGDEFISLTAFVEMFGIPTGRCDEPGVKFNYSHNYIYRTFVTESTLFMLYAGPGISAGYMRDFEVGERIDRNLRLTRTPGVMASLSGRTGCRFAFESRVELDLSFTAELGLHARRDKSVNNIDVRMYRNGLLQCLYPELSILVYL